MTVELGVLDGDGIGPEVVSSAVRVLAATALDVDLVELPVGWEAYEEHGSTVPGATLDGLEAVDGWLLGPVLSGEYPADDPAGGNPSSRLRTEFDLYSNHRPIRSYDGLGPEGMALSVFRQNTEGFYADRNMHAGDGRVMPTEDVALSVRVVTRRESRRIAEVAFAHADERGLDVTAVHKANVLARGDGLFLEAVEAVGESYPDVELETRLVDAFATELVVDPTAHDVVVTTNLFGDVLSDEAAGVVGSLGLAPGLNHNDDDGYAMAQATHGAAPDIAGAGVANPAAMILSAGLLLDWLGRRGAAGATEAAAAVSDAVTRTVEEGPRTPDVGGDATTEAFTDAVVDRLRRD
jgi:3-isopropylmalate dehydrogenase